MKQQTTHNRPDFPLMKLADTINYFHMQMPRWLFGDPHCVDMALETKVAYTFLLNRFQLSRRNGWVNRHGEVYIIYTREELAREMQISYRKAISCFKELAAHALIWEQRQGRGLPNRIYLADFVPEEKSAYSYDCAPFSSAPRDAETAVLDDSPSLRSEAKSSDNTQISLQNAFFSESIPHPTGHTDDHSAVQQPDPSAPDMSKPQFKNCPLRRSGVALNAVPDLQKPHASKKETKKIEKRNTELNQWSDDPAGGCDPIEAILQHCMMERYTAAESGVIRDAVAWLYYCRTLSIGDCAYPQSHVRRMLWRLNPDILDDALCKLKLSRSNALRNTLAYTAKVIFSTIMEMGSDELLSPAGSSKGS